MRALAVFAILTAPLLVPVFASADPAQGGAPASAISTGQPVTTVTVTPQATATAPIASNGVNPNQIVCRAEPPATGTRLGGSRECYTVQQWNEREREAQRLLQQQQGFGNTLSDAVGNSAFR